MEISLLQLAPPMWTRTTLGEIVDRGGGSIQTGPFGSQLHASDYVPDGVPSIMPVNIGDNRLIREGIACIKESDAQRLSKHIVRKGDIIYSRRGDVERRAIVREAEDGWFCGTGCLKVRLGSGVILPEFAAFYLGHPEVRSWIVRHSVGITMPNLNTSIMEAVPFLLPPMEDQRAISETLQSLDDKIEGNRRTGRALEGLARGVFKAWFVDFEPVKAKAAGATAFTGMPPESFANLPTRLIDSELGPVPEGWEVKPIGDEFDFQVGFAFKSAQFTDDPSHVRLLRGDNVKEATVEWGSKTRRWSEVSEKISQYHLAAGDVVIGMDGSKLGKNWSRISAVVLPCLLVQRVARFRATGAAGQSLLWLLISNPTFREFIDAVKTGTSIPHVSGGQLRSFTFVRPDDGNVLRAFEELVGPLLSMADHLKAESAKLAALRDYLLPRLLSGRVRVEPVRG